MTAPTLTECIYCGETVELGDDPELRLRWFGEYPYARIVVRWVGPDALFHQCEHDIADLRNRGLVS